ncbi:MAG TPA: hypothetical protein VGR02_14960 [Thermoanaerobaculia bacterium]|nr:hypothetical protein [Thermoanaerobaculia bacterium]
MKKSLILAAALLACSCRVEKTGEDTYKVVTPTPEAKAAAEKAREQAKVVGEQVRQSAGRAAVATGTALQKAGRQAQDKTTTVTETTATTTTRH